MTCSDADGRAVQRGHYWRRRTTSRIHQQQPATRGHEQTRTGRHRRRFSSSLRPQPTAVAAQNRPRPGGPVTARPQLRHRLRPRTSQTCFTASASGPRWAPRRQSAEIIPRLSVELSTPAPLGELLRRDISTSSRRFRCHAKNRAPPADPPLTCRRRRYPISSVCPDECATRNYYTFADDYCEARRCTTAPGQTRRAPPGADAPVAPHRPRRSLPVRARAAAGTERHRAYRELPRTGPG